MFVIEQRRARHGYAFVGRVNGEWVTICRVYLVVGPRVPTPTAPRSADKCARGDRVHGPGPTRRVRSRSPARQV